MRKIIPLVIIIIVFLSSCITFEKQSPLTTLEYLEGMPLVLEFERPVVRVEIYDGNKLIHSYDGDIIYELKTNLILHNDITVKITEYYKNRQYTNIVKKVEPQIQFLLYVGADNSLDQKYTDPITNENNYFIDLDISEIRNSVKKSDKNIVISVLEDRYAKNDKILFISKFNGIYYEYYETPKTFNFEYEISSASSETLYKFLDVFTVRSSNTIKILDLWDHGNGWALESKGIETKAIIQDESDNNRYLKIKDIKNVLSKYQNNYNMKINILSFDACNMMSLEILYEFRNLIDYYVGSVYSIAGYGFYYDFFDGLSNIDLEKNIVSKIIEKYKYYYTSIYSLGRLSLSAIDMNKFKIIWDKIKNISSINDEFSEINKMYMNDGNSYVAEPTNMIDVNGLLLNTGEFLSYYVNQAIVNSVVRIDGVDYPNYSGIGIMFEDIFNNSNSYYDDYKALDFYNDFQQWIEGTWKNIIQSYK